MPVLLKQLPVDVFLAFDAATEELLREYLLVALDGKQPFSVSDVANVRQAKRIVSDAIGKERPRDVPVDLEVTISADETAWYGLMQGVLDHANRLAYDEQLLALPVLPEIAHFRNWLCDEVVGQTGGAEPTEWQLPAQVLDTPGVRMTDWPGLADLPPAEAWIVGDDGNRIIAASPAALELLGWEDLVGERILVIIPPAMRGRHVAAFTRGVVSGEHHVLEQPLHLTAWTRDGSELPITLTLSKHEGAGERTVFLGRLAPR